VVIEAAGTREGLTRSIDLVAPGGTVVVLGVRMGTVELVSVALRPLLEQMWAN